LAETLRDVPRTTAFDWFVRLYIAASLGLFANLFNLSPLALPGLFNVAWASLYAATLPLLLSLVLSGMAARSWAILGFSGYLILSTVWSQLPQQTLQNSIAIAMNMGFAIVCAERLSVKRFSENVRWALNAMVLLSLLTAAVGMPSAWYQDVMNRPTILGTNPIQGLFSHKIFFGVYSTAALIFNAIAIGGVRRMLIVSACLLAILLSGSTTALFTALVACVLLLLVGLYSKGFFQFAVGPLTGILLATLIILPSAFEPILNAFGRDATLTGRTELWAWALWFFEKRPILGWGYRGIFGDSIAAPGHLIALASGYEPPHFHSGYLQVLTETGVLGASLFMIILLASITRLAASSIADKGNAHAAALLIAILALASISAGMNILLHYNDITTLLIVFGFCHRWRDIRTSKPMYDTSQGRTYLRSAIT